MNNSLKSIITQLSENFIGLEETNVTSNLDGGEGQPNTPYAFSKKVHIPDEEGYSEPVHPTDRFFKQIDDIYRRVNEANYNDFKKDDTRNERTKINEHIVLINRKLREVEQMINHASRLKLETGSNQTVFWKGTLNNFTKINERLIRLSNKIREMSA